jgi:hypothetical protein
MERDAEGKPATGVLADAEENADRLAYELLAPARLVLSTGLGSRGEKNRQVLEESLGQVYGLPNRQAAHYADVLLPRRPRDPLLIRLKDFS